MGCANAVSWRGCLQGSPCSTVNGGWWCNTVHGPPLQARVVAANGTVLAACKLLLAMIPARMEMNRGQSKIERGKNDEGSGHGMAKASRHTQPAEQGRCRRTQPADNPTGTGLKETTASSWPASQQNNSRRRRWPASRRAVQVDGGRAVVLATQEAGSDLPTCLPPTYRLCLSPSIPTPLICETQFSPNLFFCFYYFYSYFPTINSSPNPLYRHCSANLSCRLAYSQPRRSLPGGE